MSQLINQIGTHLKQNNLLAAEKLSWDLYHQNKRNFLSVKTLGMTLLMQQKFAGALNIFIEANELKDDDYDVLVNLAHLYIKFDEFEKVFIFANKALSLNAEPYYPYISLAEFYLKRREFEKAYAMAIELQKRVTYAHLTKNHQTLYLMLDVFIASGNEKDAWNFISLSHSKSFLPELFYYQAGLSVKSIDQKLLLTAEDFIKNSKFSNHIERAKALAPVYFALGRSYLKQDPDLSDSNYIKGNNEITKIQRYRPLENQFLVKKIKSSFENYAPSANQEDGEGLIFITGMPRSGTTLLESILDSSGEVFSCGELTSFHTLFHKIVDEEKNNPLESKYLKEEEMGTTYLRRVHFLNQVSQKKYILDKLPGNFSYIGFIKKRFPRAKVIYIKRDPWDNAISLYQQFYVANIAYASTFFNIAIYYADHEEIVRYWTEEAQVDFLKIDYEELVSHTSEVAENIFHYCGLSSNYNEEKRQGFFSRTASKNQVRAGVHQQSLQKKSFEKQKINFLETLQTQRVHWSKSITK